MTLVSAGNKIAFTPLPPQDRGRRRRAQIVDAAWDLVAANGHKGDGVSIREIGRRANASTGTIYHYFNDLDEIVGAVAGVYRERLVEATTLPPGMTDWRLSIAESHRRYAQFFARYPRLRALWFDSQASAYVQLIHREFRADLARGHQERLAKLTGVPVSFEDCTVSVTVAGALFELAFSQDPLGDPLVLSRVTEVVQDFYVRRFDTARDRHELVP